MIFLFLLGLTLFSLVYLIIDILYYPVLTKNSMHRSQARTRDKYYSMSHCYEGKF